MAKVAIISVDGHVRGSRAMYREYIERKHLETYDEQVKTLEAEGVPDQGNLNPEYPQEHQWDSKGRLEALESVGVVAEVLFSNGQPFQVNRLEDFARSSDPELAEAGRQTYNRWLVDFCAEAPGRRSGQMVVSFDDVDRAVRDIHWAKEHGLGGIVMPPLNPGGTFFFDPALDPAWAAVVDTGLVVSQHGGAGLPAYSPAGVAAMFTIAIESGFYSARSMWQMIVGGVFDRFPDLRVAWIETQVRFLVPSMDHINSLWGDDGWLAFARRMGREINTPSMPAELMGRNIFVGVSPFGPKQIDFGELVGKDEHGADLPGFHFGVDATMFGLDYPHFESHFNRNDEEVRDFVSHPSITDDDARKIFWANAAELYGFDVDALQPVVDRVGFDLEDVRATVPA
jgi:predicted TIM-barrel fold metal-dependent hydrolase